MIVAKGIHKSFGKLHVLKGIDLEVKKGEIVSIVGTSGAGKTTLLHILGTLDRADQGSIEINNTAIHTLKDRELSRFRNRHIGFVFQFHYLLPEFTAIENVCLPGFIATNPEREVRKKIEDLLSGEFILECAFVADPEKVERNLLRAYFETHSELPPANHNKGAWVAESHPL